MLSVLIRGASKIEVAGVLVMKQDLCKIPKNTKQSVSSCYSVYVFFF